MKHLSHEIARNPGHMRVAEREGIALQVRNFVREAECERGPEKGRGLDRDDGLER